MAGDTSRRRLKRASGVLWRGMPGERRDGPPTSPLDRLCARAALGGTRNPGSRKTVFFCVTETEFFPVKRELIRIVVDAKAQVSFSPCGDVLRVED